MIEKNDFYSDAYAAAFRDLYADNVNEQPARYAALAETSADAFGARGDMRFFSAPGRSEIGGNHTDHQQGCVLAAAVTLDVAAAAAKRRDGVVRIHSAGYAPLTIDLNDLGVHEEERESSAALVRGTAAALRRRGYAVGGFDAAICSAVPKGSGLSSSAAYSVLLCTIFSCLYNDGRVPPVEQALCSQFAENVYFGKPSGLMDQLACALGGFAAIDFRLPETPQIERIDCDLASLGYAICIVNAGGSHADLTGEYAAVPGEMKAVAAYFGKPNLRETDEAAFYRALPALRACAGDRAVLRAMHFFGENARVARLADALKARDMAAFRALMNESGRSSFELLQNVCPTNAKERSVALALAVTERMLDGCGAWRVHGGGFAGTIQALVPLEQIDAYSAEMERVFGAGSCYRLSIRSAGGVELLPGR